MTDATAGAPTALLEVQAIKFIDVRKKEQLYIIFRQGLDEHVINVGKETFEKVGGLVTKSIAERSKQLKETSGNMTK